MTEREERLARNEAVFRDVNENIQKVAEQLDRDKEHHLYEYLCECAQRHCTERIELTLSEYEAVRQTPTWFALVDGHQLPEIEIVVERHDRYIVVEKQDAAAQVAQETDPRDT